MVIYKGFKILRRQKYPKNRGRNCHFSKIDALLKALYVR